MVQVQVSESMNYVSVDEQSSCADEFADELAGHPFPSCPFEADCLAPYWDENQRLAQTMESLELEHVDMRQALTALSLSFASLWSNYDAYQQFVRAVSSVPGVVSVWTIIENDTVHVTTLMSGRDLVARDSVYDAELMFMDYCRGHNFDFSVKAWDVQISETLRGEKWQSLYQHPEQGVA